MSGLNKVGIVLVSLALWCVTFIFWFFTLPTEQRGNITDKAEHTASIFNVGSDEDVRAKLDGLAREEGYSYVLLTGSDLSVGTIYDPAGRYELPPVLQEGLAAQTPLVRAGVALEDQVGLVVGTQPEFYELTPYEADIYPDLILPPSSERHPVYYEILVSADHELDGQRLAGLLSPMAIYEGTTRELAEPSRNWIIYLVYMGSALLVFLVYLLIMHTAVRSRRSYLRTADILGASLVQQLGHLLKGSAVPSLLVLLVCAALSYLYQFTPYAGILQGNPRYLTALLTNSLLAPALCLLSALGLSYLRVKAVRHENLS